MNRLHQACFPLREAGFFVAAYVGTCRAFESSWAFAQTPGYRPNVGQLWANVGKEKAPGVSA